MTKEEIAQFIQDNLTIHLDTNYDGYTGNRINVTVKLKLSGEVISQDYISLTEGE